MERFAGFLWDLYAYLAGLPFLVFAGVWIAVYGWKRDKRQATLRSVDITMFFLFGAAAGLLDQLFGFSYGSVWLLILLFLLAFGLIGNAQQRIKGKLDLLKAWKLVWRVGFLVFSAVYVLLMLIGIIVYAVR